MKKKCWESKYIPLNANLDVDIPSSHIPLVRKQMFMLTMGCIRGWEVYYLIMPSSVIMQERYILIGNYESLILKLKQSQQQRTCSDLNLQHVSTCCTCSLHVSTTSMHFHTNTAYNPPERIWHKRKLR